MNIGLIIEFNSGNRYKRGVVEKSDYFKIITKNPAIQIIFETILSLNHLVKHITSNSCRDKTCLFCRISSALNQINPSKEVNISNELEEYFRNLKANGFSDLFEQVLNNMHRGKHIKCPEHCPMSECFIRLYQKDECDCGFYFKNHLKPGFVAIKVKKFILPASSYRDDLIINSEQNLSYDTVHFTNCKLLYNKLGKIIKENLIDKDLTKWMHFCESKKSKILCENNNFNLFILKFDWSDCEKTTYHALQCMSLIKVKINLLNFIENFKEKTLRIQTIILADFENNVIAVTWKNPKWCVIENGSLSSLFSGDSTELLIFIYKNMYYPLYAIYDSSSNCDSKISINFISLLEALSYNRDIGVNTDYDNEEHLKMVYRNNNIKNILICCICRFEKHYFKECYYCNFLDGDWVCKICDSFMDKDNFICSNCNAKRLNETNIMALCNKCQSKSEFSGYCYECEPIFCWICNKKVMAFEKFYCVKCKQNSSILSEHLSHTIYCVLCEPLAH